MMLITELKEKRESNQSGVITPLSVLHLADYHQIRHITTNSVMPAFLITTDNSMVDN
jgi:hypothetical protein